MDEKLALEIKEMYDNKKVGEKPENLLRIYEFVKQFSMENEELQEELEDINEFQAQIHISDPEFKCWIKLGDGKFEYGENEIEDPSFTLSCTQEIMGGMMQGEIDSMSAYMSGELTIDGNLQNSMAYGEFLGLAMELSQDLE
ncbi:MAG: SCP2 sterol-binding domain-containing protein [Promethearchaeota archaeon]|nr:MAG: SCP2 sterol-binding domain-containing protein [Candidatus Lokiarchaeota archaeon]